MLWADRPDSKVATSCLFSLHLGPGPLGAYLQPERRQLVYVPVGTPAVIEDVVVLNSAKSRELKGWIGSYLDKCPLLQADPVILEPIMKVVVTVPEEYMGDVIGDLNSRRGRINGMEAVSGAQQITAMVPLSEMFGYATDLRSKTQGRGQYTMEPDHYAEVPKFVSDNIISERGKKAE